MPSDIIPHKQYSHIKREEYFQTAAEQARDNQFDIEMSSVAPRDWIKLLRKVNEGKIRELLLSESMPVDVLSSELVIEKIEILLKKALRTLTLNVEWDNDGNPKYNDKNIRKFRSISGASILQIGGIPELQLLPEIGSKVPELPTIGPDRYDLRIGDQASESKKIKELQILLQKAAKHIRLHVRETRVLTKRSIDVVIADLMAILRYCEAELWDIQDMKETNAAMKADGASVEETLRELRDGFQFPVRKRKLTDIYYELCTVLNEGLGMMGVSNAINGIVGKEYTTGMIAEARKGMPNTSQIIANGRSVVDDVFRQALKKRRDDEMGF
ncbi:hypothetical protein JW758_00285 [Candidatus Peregrinibacteria bacterium]|nr:hypothetical protein [Candidatus Peregrinibacteria bacterium]